MGSNRQRNFKIVLSCVVTLWLFYLSGCKEKATANTAFYAWKTVFRPSEKETVLFKDAASNHLYLRFFDVIWNTQVRQALPNAVVSIQTPTKRLIITPVIYITNQSLEKSRVSEMGRLAFNANRLLHQKTTDNHIAYNAIQIDCDWTVGTRIKYFTFLRAFKRYSGKRLEATIRLHQVKYPERTGVPPVDRGVLMFYNMGKISADLSAVNSIYNQEDAAAYIGSLPNYHLPLDVAMPLFSWAIHIRAAKVVQLYTEIRLSDLSNTNDFVPVRLENAPCPTYQSLHSFYLKGVYIKKGDFFKFEGMNLASLTVAAKQVADKLPFLENRNIIYYESSSIRLLPLYAQDIKEISAHF
jgi:hypothetical protein